MTLIYEQPRTHIWSHMLARIWLICWYSYMTKLDYHMNVRHMIIWLILCTYMIRTYMIHCTYMTLIYEYSDIWHSYMIRFTDEMTWVVDSWPVFSPFLGSNASLGWRTRGFKPIAFPFEVVCPSLWPLKGLWKSAQNVALKDRFSHNFAGSWGGFLEQSFELCP